MADIYPAGSPKWGWTTKLIVGITLVVIFLGLLMQFRNYIGPILMAIILAYLGYPVAHYLSRTLKISWRLAATLFYLVLVLVILGILTLSGLALIEQVQSLLNLLNQAISTLPQWVEQLSTQVYVLGPFRIDFTRMDLQSFSTQILNTVQPLLGEMGSLVGRVATGAAGFMGLVFFVLLTSYFITAESGGNPARVLPVDIPGYSVDFRLLSRQLSRIWDTFLRGQLVLFVLTVVIYEVLLTTLGMRYSIGLAFLAGLGRFLPYVGPAIVWIVYALVAFFQGSTIFGLSPLGYTLLVLGLAMLIDTTFDNVISPKFLGSTLKVHPAGVLIAAIVAANLIGLVGVLLAAPVLASLQLLFNYALRKMFDLDPWDGIQEIDGPPSFHMIVPGPIRQGLGQARTFVVNRWGGWRQSWLRSKQKS